jgi:serine/threonine-protein kinase
MAYAHSRGVLHRDLKPGNIMLGKYGETLVVDWGLAKALGERPAAEGLAEQTLRPSGSGSSPAQTRGAVGTPAYMSPEQAAGKSDQLGPASDVYSLGATLYALLTGKAPISGRDHHEVLRRVQAGDFPAPRQVKPQVAPALEAVCRKAMALRPEDRYGSAKKLAEDVEHWLAGEPVKAWPEPWRVRAGRWLKRHRTFVTSGVAALVVAALVLAGATLLLSAAYENERAAKDAALAAQAEAQTQRDEAQTQRQRADANFARARQAVEDYLTRVTDHPRLKAHDFRDLRKELLTTAIPFLDDFVRQRAEDPKLEAERGRAYLKLAVIRAEIGEVGQAMRDYEVVKGIAVRLAAAYPAEADYRNALAVCHNNLGRLLARQGKRAEAEAAYREALRLQQDLVAAARPAVADYGNALAVSHNNLGLLLADQGKWAEAETAYRAAVRRFQELAGAHHDVAAYRSALASSHNNLGNLFAVRGERRKAEAAFREALGLRQELAAAHPAVPDYRRELAYTQNSLGVVLADLQKRDEAETACRAAVRLFRELAAAHPSVPDYRGDLATSHYNLGFVLAKFGRRGEAEKAYREAIPIQAALAEAHAQVPEYHRGLALSHYHLGVLLEDLGRSAEAEATYGVSVRLLEVLAKTHPTSPEYGQELARSRKHLDRLRAREAAPGRLRIRRALELARAGEHVNAAAAAEELVKGNTSNALYYGAAAVLAQCAAGAKDDAQLRDKYAARAVALLAELHEEGYFASAKNAARLKEDPDLAPLRQRADFRKLLAQVEKGP